MERKMRTLKISLLVFILSIIISAQEDWFWQNPLPQGNTLNDIDFFDEYFGLGVGNTSTIIKTSDGGLNWSLKESHRPEHIHEIVVVSNSVAYAIGYYFIIKTTDGGENWFTIPDPTNFYLNDIFFIDEMKGFIVGEVGHMYYTDDGGNSWTSRNSGTTAELKSIHFFNENIGMVLGYTNNYSDYIIRTTDGGITWLNCSFSNSPFFIAEGIFLTTELKAFAISMDDLFYTSNGGQTWMQQQFGSSTAFASIAFYDSLNGYISGVEEIYRTSNGGNSWETFSFSLGDAIWLYGITAPNQNLIYAAGRWGRMVYSSDGGNSWEQRSSGPLSTFRDVSFYNENYGIAIGDGIFTTSDGGDNWIVSTGIGPLYRCTRPSLNYCFAAGAYNLLKSTDKGFTWTRHSVSDNNYFQTISFEDTLNGIASTLSGSSPKIFRTFDGGENWQHITTLGGYDLKDICFIDSVTVYACGNGVLKSTDGGYNWININYTGLSGIQFLNSLTGFAVGGHNVIKTTDGGQNWTLINSGLTNDVSLKQVQFIDEYNGIAAGKSVIHTSDGGQSWEIYDLFHDYLESASMVNDSVWYTVGQYGSILKTVTGGVVPVELFSFTATANTKEVILNWSTATETNNSGFEILRSTKENDWNKIGFVPGHGTTTETQHHSFTDNEVKPCKYQYKLKQIDYDGSFEYSQIVEVEIPFVNEFSLSQNYPNPFNPSTVISYQLPVIGFVTLKVYDILGREVATLVNEEKPAGEYEVEFSAKGGSASGGDAYNLPSGIYFYQLKAGQYSETRKMILLK
jgi:photosystem II stability/assembly factor-like uncharacterized protein